MRMPGTLRIAWRNLWRNRRRTSLALSAIGLSVMLVLAYDAILRAYADWILATVTGPMLGHVQAHAPGWREDRAMDRTLRGVSGAVAALHRDPLVAGASARVYAPALAALAEEGFAVLVIGLDPAAESGPARLLAEATEPPGGRRVLMGKLLAEQMGVRGGDQVALVGQAVDGSTANDLYTVAALVDTPVDQVNRQGVLMELGEAQALFALGDEAHEIVLHARDPQRLGELTARVAGFPALRGAEVLNWRQLAPEMVSILQLLDVISLFALALVFVAAAAGVANTMLMATFERTHELGMLLALGAGPGRIVRLVLAESIALGVVGALLGTTLGVGLVVATHDTGIDFARLTGGGPQAISFAGMRWSLLFYPTLTVRDVLQTVGAVLLTALVASLWPAVRAARLQPARALRE